MIKADNISELHLLLNDVESEQIVQVPARLLFELYNKVRSRTFVQNFKQSEENITHCENKDEAQALANFLWNEAERHRRDIVAINVDLDLLWKKWYIGPHCIRRFVKP